jgi:hypothetical protein
MNARAQIAFSLFLMMGCTVTISACTTKLSPNPTDTTSSTTPGVYFTQDGILRADQKVDAFATFNCENLKDEMARGQGEYLTSLGTLLDVPEDRRAEFYTLMRERYPVLVPSDRTTPGEMIAALKSDLSARSIPSKAGATN